MTTRAPFGIDEWYHCFNRGFEKSRVFKNDKDYKRFLMTIYLCNSGKRMHVREATGWDLHQILSVSDEEQGESIVDIGAYALMPNHVHFILKEKTKGGIALFMQKVFTSYTMYFNKKYDRTGSLFAGTFKSKHIPDDRYLKRVIPYVLLNPENSSAIAYSSLPDFLGEYRLENKIVTDMRHLYDYKPTKADLIKEAEAFSLG